MSDSTSLSGERSRWSSRFTFILGAIGSAVGLGNLWRFPSLVYEHGGAAFLLPYAVAFFVFGVPLLFLELLMGRHFQGGDPVCFAGIDRRLKGIGWTSVMNSFIIATFYQMIIGIAILYFIASFHDPLPWTTSPDYPIEDPSAHFLFNVTLKFQADPSIQETANPYLIIATLFVWVCVFFSIWKGVEVVSKVVLISVPLPIILLFVLLGVNLSLEGHELGLQEYMGKFDISALNSAKVWQDAIGQIFFSIGVCFGVMTAYSSYRDPNEGVLVDTLIISVCNSLISILAGFVVFTSLGVLAFENNTEVSELPVGGLGLVFVAYPNALQYTPLPNFFSAVFFGVLFFLALDSAFSLVEACTTAFHDSAQGKHMSREWITLYTCIACCCITIFYTLDNGLQMLDIVDNYVNNYNMLLLGALECVAAGWFYRFGDVKKKVGVKSAWLFGAGYWVSMTIGIFVFVLAPAPYNMAGFAPIFVGIIGSWSLAYMLNESDMGVGEFFIYMGSYGVGVFTELMVRVDFNGNHSLFTTVFSVVWSIAIKFVVPVVLEFILLAGIKAGFENPYGGFGGGWQNMGGFIVLLGAGILIVYWITESAYLKAHGITDYSMEPSRGEEEEEDKEVELKSLA